MKIPNGANIRKLFLTLFILLSFLNPVFADSLKDKFSFAVIGDTRPAEAFGETPKTFSKAIDKINAIKSDFVIHLGDSICLDMSDKNIAGIETQWQAFQKEINKLSMPLYVAIGNEDVWSATSQDYFKKLFGPKLYYSFDYKNSHFIILNSELAGRANDIPEEERLWLEDDLEATDKDNIFVFLHRPIIPFKHAWRMSEKTRDYLKNLFSKYNVKAVFSGHEHLYREDIYGGVRYYITGGGGAPLHVSADEGGFYHFLVVKVKGEEFRVEAVKIE